jgi:phosphoesterase RecJ-like protein
MNQRADNEGEADYQGKLELIAERLLAWTGPFVIISHVEPDGDALGSSLALKRALEDAGKNVTLPLTPPPFLQFLADEGELSANLEELPENCMLVILDVADEPRTTGAPLEGAAFTINIDHHGTNGRFGDLSLVQPDKAATAQMVKDLITAMEIPWTVRIATPCLTGLITDTGSFRFANTNASVLRDAADLMAVGVDYPELADRLQWRPRGYFELLGKVLSTATYPLEGKVALAWLTPAMEEAVTAETGDSDDYAGLLRYADGTLVSIFLKERPDHTKVSVRSRAGVSAQAICMELGGGGHVPAAGAKVAADLAVTTRLVLEAAERELRRSGHLSEGSR